MADSDVTSSDVINQCVEENRTLRRENEALKAQMKRLQDEYDSMKRDRDEYKSECHYTGLERNRLQRKLNNITAVIEDRPLAREPATDGK